MKNYEETAKQIIKQMGEKENIKNVYHCMTRLRFELIDDSKANLEAVKKVNGVMGTVVDGREIQIIIGPEVGEVYDKVLAITGLQRTAMIEENKDDVESIQNKNIKNIATGIVNTFAACMNPIVPMFVLLGMLNVIAILIGPTFLQIVTEKSNLYRNFYWTAQAIIYFLPIFLAITSARHFKTNEFLSLVLACILLYPDLVSLMTNGISQYTVYGITALSVTYSGSVIPIMLIVWIQSYIEKVVKKIIPNSMKVVLEPLLVTLIMLPLALCVFGPVGNYIGYGLGSFFVWLRVVAGPIETTLVGAICVFLTAFGIGRPIFFICLSTLLSTGSEAAYMPIALALTNFVSMGVAFGYMLQHKDPSDRELGLTCFISNLLGGVSEPTLFGILLPNKETWIPAMVGGALGGIWLGIMNVVSYQFGPSNILSVLTFIGDKASSNFINGVIACVIGFIATVIALLITNKRKA
ncbi:PTS transporter subunit EIIC [Absicoccus porci]|jgi:PTS system beta-glucosides-specific IIC component|uniref:PTS transporter subunit EIIC n=1 Tax=Absicoccus porci TaxID=2486576 RepID=UPI003D8F8D78